MKKYVAALRAGRFDEAYGMLTDGERKYFGDAAAYRSVFEADGFALEGAKVVGARGDDRGRVFFVRERIAYVDHASDERRVIDAARKGHPIGDPLGRGHLFELPVKVCQVVGVPEPGYLFNGITLWQPLLFY